MPLWFERRDGRPWTDERFGWPLCTPDEAAPATAWSVITDDPMTARTAVEAGAGGVLVPLARTLDAAGRMAVALSVIEAEQGLGDGDILMMALVAGPGAALALATDDLPPRRTLALGIDRAALAVAAGEAGAATAAGLVALTAAARGIVCFAAAASLEDTTDGFAVRLVASNSPPNGKSRSKA